MDSTKAAVSITITLLVTLNLYLMKVINHLENERSESQRNDYPSPKVKTVITDQKWADEKKKLNRCYKAKADLMIENGKFKNRLDGLLKSIRGKGAGNTAVKKQADPFWIAQAKKDGKIPMDEGDQKTDEKTNLVKIELIEEKKPGGMKEEEGSKVVPRGKGKGRNNQKVEESAIENNSTKSD